MIMSDSIQPLSPQTLSAISAALQNGTTLAAAIRSHGIFQGWYARIHNSLAQQGLPTTPVKRMLNLDYIALHNAGTPAADIARKFNVSRQSVSYVLKRAEARGFLTRPMPKKVRTEARAKRASLWEKGYSPAEIAQRTGSVPNYVKTQIQALVKRNFVLRPLIVESKPHSYADMWNAGSTLEEIGNQVGIKPRSVWVTLRKAQKAGIIMLNRPLERKPK
jgi:DNA-binding MarR family transcriptional regulator